MRIYLAHPISGRSFNDIMHYYAIHLKELKKVGFNVIYPFIGEGFMRNETRIKPHGYDTHPIITNHAIYKRDIWNVERCDILLVDLRDAKRVSIGCVIELQHANSISKHTIVIMEKHNIHRHAMLLEASDIVFETWKECEDYLLKLKRSEI